MYRLLLWLYINCQSMIEWRCHFVCVPYWSSWFVPLFHIYLMPIDILYCTSYNILFKVPSSSVLRQLSMASIQQWHASLSSNAGHCKYTHTHTQASQLVNSRPHPPPLLTVDGYCHAMVLWVCQWVYATNSRRLLHTTCKRRWWRQWSGTYIFERHFESDALSLDTKSPERRMYQ